MTKGTKLNRLECGKDRSTWKQLVGKGANTEYRRRRRTNRGSGGLYVGGSPYLSGILPQIPKLDAAVVVELVAVMD